MWLAGVVLTDIYFTSDRAPRRTDGPRVVLGAESIHALESESGGRVVELFSALHQPGPTIATLRRGRRVAEAICQVVGRDARLVDDATATAKPSLGAG